MIFRFPFYFFLCATLVGCSTSYEDTALKSWDMMKDGKADDAIKLYEKNVTSGKDKLLKLMDEGMLLRTAKRYDESNQKFFAAAKIIEMNGYLSIGEQAVTLLSNEKQTTYQGEDFEKVLVHMYLGLNYIAMNNYEDALVETRKVNEILYQMISQAKRPYELNAFARYLNALLYESDDESNDAYIEYQNVLKIDPTIADRFPTIKIDLLRTAKQNGFSDQVDAMKKKFGDAAWKQAQQTLNDHDGAVVLLFESGKSPRKYSSREKHTRGTGPNAVDLLLPIAYYKTRPTSIHSAELEVDGVTARTVVLNDIEKTAIKHLQDRMGRAIAKALLTAGVKAGIATGIGKATNSAELGLLAGLVLFATSEADTRSWLLLPADLQVAKIFVKPGKYDAKVSFLKYSAQPAEIISDIIVKTNHVSFIQRRAFD